KELLVELAGLRRLGAIVEQLQLDAATKEAAGVVHFLLPEQKRLALVRGEVGIEARLWHRRTHQDWRRRGAGRPLRGLLLRERSGSRRRKHQQTEEDSPEHDPKYVVGKSPSRQWRTISSALFARRSARNTCSPASATSSPTSRTGASNTALRRCASCA